jgi:ribosomal-protein-alanine N-acetyltransferase
VPDDSVSPRRRFASGLADRLIGAAVGPVLNGRRVVVRPLRPTDFNAWAEVRQRCGEWLTKWEPRRPAGQPDLAQNRRAFEQRCEQRDQDRSRGVAYGFGIFLADRFVGEINLNTIQRGAAQSGYVGYWIDQAHAGHGFMPEAVVVVARFAFEDLGLHRIQISIVPRNGPSRRVVEKLNIRDEGVAVRYLEINGVWEDHVRYAMTAEEWTERRDELVPAWIVGPR